MVMTEKQRVGLIILRRFGIDKAFDKGLITIQGSGSIGSKQTIVATAKGMKLITGKTGKKMRRKTGKKMRRKKSIFDF